MVFLRQTGSLQYASFQKTGKCFMQIFEKTTYWVLDRNHPLTGAPVRAVVDRGLLNSADPTSPPRTGAHA